MNEKKICTNTPGAMIKTLHFLHNLRMGPISYIASGWKGLPVTNTLAYWAHS